MEQTPKTPDTTSFNPAAAVVIGSPDRDRAAEYTAAAKRAVQNLGGEAVTGAQEAPAAEGTQPFAPQQEGVAPVIGGQPAETAPQVPAAPDANGVIGGQPPAPSA